MFASISLVVVLATQSIVISAPTDPVPLGQMVELQIETELPNVIVQAVGRRAFDVVPVYQTVTPGLWVFAGPEDEYLVTVTASGPDGLAQRSVKLLIGPRPPPPPDVTPTPEGPKATVIVYPDQTVPPIAGQGATNTLRDSGETVFFVNAGAETIAGQTPAFLEAAISKATEVGLPAVVVLYGDTVKASKKLTTRQAAVDFVRAN